MTKLVISGGSAEMGEFVAILFTAGRTDHRRRMARDIPEDSRDDTDIATNPTITTESIAYGEIVLVAF